MFSLLWQDKLMMGICNIDLGKQVLFDFGHDRFGIIFVLVMIISQQLQDAQQWEKL